MTFDAEAKNQLSKNLSRKAGGGLHLNAESAQLIDTPILAIGLGGTGLDALIRLKHLINERLNITSEDKKPNNIEYLAIDTDKRMKNHSFKGTKFSEAYSESCIIEEPNLTEVYRSLKTGTYPHISEWISDNINTSQITNGAGAVRQLGRFLLFKEIRRVRDEIEMKIKKIVAGRQITHKQSVYVFITTGISGGTGSGTFIDIPYIVRSVLSGLGYQAQILGFLFLPDVNLLGLPQNEYATKNNVQSNGFAALKELDYLMNLGTGRNGDSFTQDYGSFSVSYDRSPYDICHLVSSVNKNGNTRFSKEDCMIVAAETIFNFIVGERDAAEFTIAQYLSNISRLSDSFVATLKVRHPINYRYNVIGSSTGILPMDDVLNYLTHLLFKDVKLLYDKTPSEKEISDLILQLNMSYESLEIAIENNVQIKDISLFNYDVIKSDSLLVERTLQECVQVTLSDIMDNNVKALLSDFKERAKHRVNEIFKDLERGPAYVSRLISSVDDYCLLKYIRELVEGELLLQRVSEAEIRRLRTVYNNQLKKITETQPLLGFNKEGIAREFKASCLEYYTAILKNNKLDKISACYTKMYEILNQENNKVFAVFTEIISNLMNIFAEYAEVPTKTTIDNGEHHSVFTWDIINKADLATEIQLMILNDSQFKINIREIVSRFVRDLIDNSTAWLDDIPNTLPARLNEFIISNFNAITRESIDFYIARLSGDPNKEGDLISTTATRLQSGSSVMFPLNVYGDGLTTPHYNYISVPFNSDKFKSHLAGKGLIKQSVITNRISMLNVNLAYPLMAYRELETYESTYEEFFRGNTAYGLHLYQTESKNWNNLPSPIYQKIRSVGTKNLRQDQYDNQTRNIFDKAEEYGYLVLQQDQSADNTKEHLSNGINKNYFAFYTNEKLDIKQVLAKAGLPDVNDLTLRSDIQKALTLLRKLLNDASRKTESTKLYDVFIQRDTGLVNREYSQGILMNMPTLREILRRMVAEHEQLLTAIKRLEEKNGDFASLAQFASCLYTAQIKRDKRNYKYVNKNELAVSLFTIPIDYSDDYYEYAVFNAFLSMNEADKKHLVAQANKALDGDNQDEILAQMQTLLKRFTEKRQKLTDEYEGLEDGIKKAEFYSEIRNELQKAIDLYNEE